MFMNQTFPIYRRSIFFLKFFVSYVFTNQRQCLLFTIGPFFSSSFCISSANYLRIYRSEHMLEDSSITVTPPKRSRGPVTPIPTPGSAQPASWQSDLKKSGIDGKPKPKQTK